ncbi:MAG: hypothetical protein KF729_14170 [Sandaracinaceae bacterium]|nr:hypothetical protein [Sandaracinaceae bacterium]
MRAYLGFLALLLAGCSGTGPAPGDAGGCTPGYGVIEVCVYLDATSERPLAGAEVTARRGEADVPFLIRAPEGCAREELEAGTWEVRGDDATGNCTTSFERVEVRACETTPVRIDVAVFCRG